MCNISQGIREEGREESRIQIAKKMLLKNKSIEEIIEFTELPKQTILDLSNS